MAQVRINAEGCKACLLCIEFCPRKCLVVSEKLNSRGFHPAEVKEDADCRGCKICTAMCPDVCIALYRDDAEPVGTQS